MKFLGGILDGREFEIPQPAETLRVPVRKWKYGIYLPSDTIPEEYQLYVKNGDVYELRNGGKV